MVIVFLKMLASYMTDICIIITIIIIFVIDPCRSVSRCIQLIDAAFAFAKAKEDDRTDPIFVIIAKVIVIIIKAIITLTIVIVIINHHQHGC